MRRQKVVPVIKKFVLSGQASTLIGPKPASKSLPQRTANVRFGSKADIGLAAADVRFTPKSGHRPARWQCPLWAKSGLMHCSNRPQPLVQVIADFRQ